jgi:hypothetical protein
MTYNLQDRFEDWLDQAFAAVCAMHCESYWDLTDAAPWEAFVSGYGPDDFAAELVAANALEEWT